MNKSRNTELTPIERNQEAIIARIILMRSLDIHPDIHPDIDGIIVQYYSRIMRWAHLLEKIQIMIKQMEYEQEIGRDFHMIKIIPKRAVKRAVKRERKSRKSKRSRRSRKSRRY